VPCPRTEKLCPRTKKLCPRTEELCRTQQRVHRRAHRSPQESMVQSPHRRIVHRGVVHTRGILKSPQESSPEERKCMAPFLKNPCMARKLEQRRDMDLELALYIDTCGYSPTPPPTTRLSQGAYVTRSRQAPPHSNTCCCKSATRCVCGSALQVPQ
jgi:hypothetical protein